jgi:hypothetical protein
MATKKTSTKTTKKSAAPAASDAGKARVEFAVSADKHRLIVQAQRDFIDSIADRVEKGEPFKRAAERKVIAGILRAWAKRIPDAPPSKSVKMDPGNVAIHFACLVNGQGRSKAAANAELAQIYDVSPEAIRAAIAKFEEPAMRLVPRKVGASSK